MKKLLIIIFFAKALNFGQIAYGQSVGISDVLFTPNVSSMLEVRSTNKGVLIPRISLVQTTSASPITSPAVSLLVYNQATVNDVTPGFYFWSGTAWVRLLSGTIPTAGWQLTGNTALASDLIGTTNSVDFRMFTNNTERMRITSAGNVGIGTSTPTAARLVVSGVSNIGVHGQFDANSWGRLGTQFDGIEAHSNKAGGYALYAHAGASATGGIWARGTLSGHFQGMATFQTDITGQFSIVATRNTLTANDFPSSVVEIVRQTTAATMGANMGSGMVLSLQFGAGAIKEQMGAVHALRNGADNQGRLVFSTRSIAQTWPEERMTILHNGNVGIGTNDPWSRLNVKNGRIVVEYDAGIDFPGLWHTDNPWVYLWRRETNLAANQGGNIIFAASMNTAGTAADIAMIAGGRENAINNNTASFMGFYTRPATGDWLERLRINSTGHFEFRPENASGRTIILNDLGVGTGTEPTIVPSSHHFGFVGTATRAWWRMHAGAFNVTSTRDVKANITVLTPEERQSYYQMVKNLNVCSYNYIKTDLDSLGNVVSKNISPRQSIGLIADEAPEMIKDETGKAISLYEYVSILAVALQEAQRRIEELELVLRQNGIKNSND